MKKEAIIITLIVIATIAIIIPIIFDFSFNITGNAILENTGCNYEFIRGDANHDGIVNYFDSQFLLNYLFSGGQTPDCFDACDANDDNNLDIGDVASLNDYSANGIALPQPFPNPGTDEACDYIDNDNDSLKDEGCIRKCIDSDGGKNYSFNGSVKETYGTSKSQVSDMCNRITNEVWEWYCDIDNTASYVIYQCPYICKEGACTSAQPPSQPPQQNITQNTTNQSSIPPQANTSQSSAQTQNQTSNFTAQSQNNTHINQAQNQTSNFASQSQNNTTSNLTAQNQSNTNQSSNQAGIKVNIISPEKYSNVKEGVIQYTFSIESQEQIISCILALNDLPAEELTSVSLTQPNTFSHETPKGTHSFYVTCIDTESYYTSSDETTFTVYEEQGSGSTGTDSSAGGSTNTDSTSNEENKKVKINEQDLEQGVSFDLAFDETIELRFNNKGYSLVLGEIQDEYAIFLLSNSQKEIKIDLDNEQEIDLDDDGNADINIAIEKISSESINMQIKSSQISGGERHSGEKTKSNAVIYLAAVIISTIMIVVIIVTLMLLSQSRKRSNLEKSLKDYA